MKAAKDEAQALSLDMHTRALKAQATVAELEAELERSKQESVQTKDTYQEIFNRLDKERDQALLERARMERDNDFMRTRYLDHEDEMRSTQRKMSTLMGAVRRALLNEKEDVEEDPEKTPDDLFCELLNELGDMEAIHAREKEKRQVPVSLVCTGTGPRGLLTGSCHLPAGSWPCGTCWRHGSPRSWNGTTPNSAHSGRRYVRSGATGSRIDLTSSKRCDPPHYALPWRSVFPVRRPQDRACQ